MKFRAFIPLVSLLLCLFLQGCKSSGDNPEPVMDPIEGSMTVAQLPIIDGSDSTEPLRTILVAKLLGCEYHWVRNPVIDYVGLRGVVIEDAPKGWDAKAINSNTHNSFVNLIDGTVDIIITARGISRDEAKYAEGKGVKLTQKPVAIDGLVFIVNAENPVKSLTHQQIKDIYLKRITNWKEVGGEDAPITPYICNANSGSQEKFETIVMNHEEIEQMELLELEQGKLMQSPYVQLKENKYGIAFTPYYYYKYIVDWERVKTIGVNGIMPGRDSFIGAGNSDSTGSPSSSSGRAAETAASGIYPFVSTVMAVVREDCPEGSRTRQIFDLLSTPSGQAIIEESGYVKISLP